MQIMRPHGTFRALRNRNYRLYFFGQGISLIGTWMQQVAVSWLVYRLTGSEFMLGLTAFAGQIPSFLAMPFAGAIADRANRHGLLVLSQALSMFEATTMATLTILGIITVPQIIALSVFLGLVNALDMPTRQAFVMEMVTDQRDLSNAIALNSSLFNGARLIGPAIAGILIAWLGEGTCFVINAMSYIAVLVALLLMKIPTRQRAAHRAPLLAHIFEGFRYAFGHRLIRSLLVFMGALSFFGMPYSVLLPVFAKEVLGGDAQTLGWLTGAIGLGALGAALMLAGRKQVLGLGQWILYSSGVFGVALLAFSFCTVLPLSLIIGVVAGFGMMVQINATNIVLQTIVDEDKRGRVMSMYTMAFMGLAPLGSLVAGGVGEHIGVSWTIFLSGIFSLAIAIWFYRQLPHLRREARPIYIAKGIINEVPAPIPEKATH